MVEIHPRSPYGLASIPRKTFPETTLEPDLPIVDAHHHLMHRPTNRYLHDDLLADMMGGHRIAATVYCECRAFLRSEGPEALAPIGETEFANGVAAMSASGIYGETRMCAGIVGFADLSGPHVEALLEGHIAAGGGRFRGVRQGVYWDASEAVYPFVSMRPPRGLLSSDAFRTGVRHLRARDLTLDVALFHHQLPELVDLAKAEPELRIVLNHMGFALGVGPYAGRRQDVFAEWRTLLAEAASCDNIVVKAGGLGVPLWGFPFANRDVRPDSTEVATAWRPYFEACIDLFGPARCMFESNFPADRASCDYVTLWNAVKRIAQQYSAAEKARMFSGTAIETYRLPLDAAL